MVYGHYRWLKTIERLDGLAVPIVVDSIGNSFLFTILYCFERFISMNSQLALSWNFKSITERNEY